MKSKTKLQVALRQEVLDIIDKLYISFPINRKSRQISKEIIHVIIGDYASMNCGLAFIFLEQVWPYLKKMHENDRLKLVKELLTNGYIDIDDKRINMLFMPYLNYNKKIEDKKKYYITEI